MSLTFFPSLSTSIFSQLNSIKMLFTFLSSQSLSITLFLRDPSSYLFRSQLLALILLILRKICRYVKGSVGPSPVHALCHCCSDVTSSCPGLGANDITVILWAKYLKNCIFCQDVGKREPSLREYNVMFYETLHYH